MSRKLSTELIREFEGYKVVSGQGQGDLVRLMPWQKTFIRRVFDDPGIETVALSMARGSGKSSLIAMIASSALSGRLAKPGAEVVVVAGSMKQAGIVFGIVWGYLDIPMDRKKGKRNADRYGVRNSIAEMSLTDNQTGVKLRLLSSDPRRSAGLQSSLVIADECSSWLPGYGEKMHSILMTTLGKIEGSKYIAISTRASEPGHFFERYLQSAQVSMVFAADREDDLSKYATWRKACPSLPRFPTLRRTMEREYREAQSDMSAMARFKALRMNMATDDIYKENLVLQAEHWERIETDEPPPAEGRSIMGIDLSDGVALTAACMVWESGRMEGMAVFPEIPSLEEREKQDHCVGIYQRMFEDGDLRLLPGRHVKVADFLSLAFERWGYPDVIVSDRYRQTEFTEVMMGFPAIPVEWRGMGFFSATEDLRRFRKRVMEQWPKVEAKMIFRWCLSNARTISNPAGDEKLAKTGSPGRSARARDDVVAAAIIAIAHADRVFSVPQYEEVWEVHG